VAAYVTFVIFVHRIYQACKEVTVLFCKQDTNEPRHCFHLEEKAPEFCAPAYYRCQEIEVCLKDYRGKWLLLFFYAGDFTFV